LYTGIVIDMSLLHILTEKPIVGSCIVLDWCRSAFGAVEKPVE
jgi:hypothetical protein